MLLSEALGVSKTQLAKFGVFDSYLGIDAALHVDPARLRSTRVPELRGSYKRFQKTFEDLLILIESAKPGGRLEKQAIDKLVFPEVKEAALGYSKASTSGRGVTRAIAAKLYATAQEIIEAGIKSPAIFELAVLFEEDFGPDLFSDMTICILLPELGEFNRRVAMKLGIPFRERQIHGRDTVCVYSKSQQRDILMIPKSILADLPLADDWSEIDAVCEYNEGLRKRINSEIQRIWGHAKRPAKYQIKKVLIDHPALLKELIASYGRAEPEPYDFEKDPRGVVIWFDEARRQVANSPLELATPTSIEDVQKIVAQICDRFKHLIEQRSLAELLFDESDRPKPEQAAQLLFFGIADSYCIANNLDISREPETGRGPADFKLSKGHHARVIVEVKLSSNAKYLNGLTAQLPTYLNAEETRSGILILIRVGPNALRLRNAQRVHDELVKAGKRVPTLMIVDATRKASASRLQGFFDLTAS